MLPIIKVPRLKKGDTIRVVSVSAPDAVMDPERFQRGIVAIEAEGYSVSPGKSTSARAGYLSGDELLMAKDIEDAYLDPEVQAIFCAGGGTNANRLLRHLNIDAIRKNPKIFLGVSNPSVLLNAIYAATGMVTFHGPTVVWNFGDPAGLTSRTREHLWPILTSAETPKPFAANRNWKWWREGKACGRLVGGNLASLEGLLGTKWLPDFSGHIFFWEDIAKPTNRLDMCLTHFRDAGVLDKISGMIIGELIGCEPPAEGQTLEDILQDVLGEFDFPVLYNVDLGHTDDKLTIPIGVQAEINSDSPAFSLIDSAVL